MEKPFLYDAVNWLYHGVMDGMPRFIQERGMVSAFILGATGTQLVLRGIQWMSKNQMDYFIKDFDEKWLPKLELLCIGLTAIAPFLYATIDPEGARTIMTQHPTYTSGMAGVYTSSIEVATEDLVKRKIAKTKQTSLEETLNKRLLKELV